MFKSKLKKELLKRIGTIVDQVEKLYVADLANIQSKRRTAEVSADETYYQNIQDEQRDRDNAILAAKQEAEREESAALEKHMGDVIAKVFGKK